MEYVRDEGSVKVAFIYGTVYLTGQQLPHISYHNSTIEMGLTKL